MRPNWKRTWWPLLAVIALFAATAQSVAAEQPAIAPSWALSADGPAQEGPLPDPTLEAEFDAEIDAAVTAARPSANAARLRALVNDGRISGAARTSIARVLERNARSVAPEALACRRIATGDSDAVAQFERCQPWIDAHADGPLAQASCRRMATAYDVPPHLDALVSRCREVIANHEPDGVELREVCGRLAARDAAAGANDPLSRRCRAFNATVLDSAFDHASLLAMCVRAAQSAQRQTTLIYRCLSLFSPNENRTGSDNPTRSLRAELGAAAAETNVGAETEGDSSQPVADAVHTHLAVSTAVPVVIAPRSGAAGRVR